jgi:hypothetical protein
MVITAELISRISCNNIQTFFESSLPSSLSEDEYAGYAYSFARKCKTLYCTSMEMQLVIILDQLLLHLQVFADAFSTKVIEGRKMVCFSPLKLFSLLGFE